VASFESTHLATAQELPSQATFPGFEMSPKKGSIQSLCQFLEITGLFEAMIAFFSLLPKGAQVLLLLDSAVFPGYSPNL
jgi:hypothetical protein